MFNIYINRLKDIINSQYIVDTSLFIHLIATIMYIFTFVYITIVYYTYKLCNELIHICKSFIEFKTNKLIVFLVSVFIIQVITVNNGLISKSVFSHSMITSDIVGLLLSVISHNDIAHLFANIVFLYYVGHLIEHKYSSLEYYGLFFGSGIVVGLLSKNIKLLFDLQHFDSTIGSSGAIAVFIGISMIVYYTKDSWTDKSPVIISGVIGNIITEIYNTKYNYGIILYQLTVTVISGFIIYTFVIKTFEIHMLDIARSTNTSHITHTIGAITGIIYQLIKTLYTYQK